MKGLNLFRKIFISLIMIITIFNVNGVSQNKRSGGMGFFATGYQVIDINKLNSRLKLFGLPQFDKNYVTLGGGGFGILNNFVVGGEGHGLVGSDLSNQFYQTNLTAGYGLFDMGYLIHYSDGLKIFPVVGFGGGGIDLRINEKNIVDFDQVLNNPKKGSILSIAGLMLNFGLNLFYKLNLGGDDEKAGGLSFGLSLGYTHFLQLGNWSLFDTEIAGGPNVGLTGFYIRFTLGGGS